MTKQGSIKRKVSAKRRVQPRVEPEPTIEVNGERLMPTVMGALYWPERNALIVADLHFEKGSSYARHGTLLPPYDTRTTLKRLAVLCRRFEPDHVISLGDAFHDQGAEQRMDDEDAGLLEQLMIDRKWTWILGNHDPEPPMRFAGTVEASLRLGRLILRHEPSQPYEAGELAGHLHPCAKVKADTRTIRRRCFATDGIRMVLPAFGAYAGGLNILDEAFLPIFDDVTAWVLGGKGVYAFNKAVLVPDEPAFLEGKRA